jgi:hypothetical protein
MKLSDLFGHLASTYNIHLDIKHNIEFEKLRIYSFLNLRIGDRVAATAIINDVEKRDESFNRPAIIVVEHDYVDHPGYQDCINDDSRFDLMCSIPVVDARIILRSKEDKNNIFNNLVLPDVEIEFQFMPGLWETLPILAKDGIYPSMVAKLLNWWWFGGEKGEYLSVDEPYIVVHPLLDAGYNTVRNHNVGMIVSLIRRMASFGIKIVVIGLTEDQISNIGYIGHVVKMIPRSKYNVDQVMAIIAGCTLFIGGDTGFSHAAGALGRSVVAIYPPLPNDPGLPPGWDSMVSTLPEKLMKVYMDKDKGFMVSELAHEAYAIYLKEVDNG